MRKLFACLIVAAVASPVLADGLSGYRCENHCPLASIANERRAYGDEANAVSAIVRADAVERITSNLSRI